MLTSKRCVPGVVPGKQLADVSDDDAKTWKEEQIMKKKKEKEPREGIRLWHCLCQFYKRK